MTDPQSPIVILGPTAGGKSALAVELAERLTLAAELISADSMQVYRQLNAGTAKPSAELRQRVVHHLIDVVEPTQPFTVHNWLEQAQKLIRKLPAAGKRPVVVGGTNLYIQALLEGLFDGPGTNLAFRATLAGIQTADLHLQLISVDPAAAHRIHPHDRKRIVRALEVHQATGQPISQWQTQWPEHRPRPDGPIDTTLRSQFILIGLAWPTATINRRINARVKQMFQPPDGIESLPQETRRLEAAGLLGPQARQALGYKQCLAAQRGELTLAQAMEKTQILTRRFAKQQRTWLRRFHTVRWIDASSGSVPQWIAQALQLVDN